MVWSMGLLACIDFPAVVFRDERFLRLGLQTAEKKKADRRREVFAERLSVRPVGKRCCQTRNVCFGVLLPLPFRVSWLDAVVDGKRWVFKRGGGRGERLDRDVSGFQLPFLRGAQEKEGRVFAAKSFSNRKTSLHRLLSREVCIAYGVAAGVVGLGLKELQSARSILVEGDLLLDCGGDGGSGYSSGSGEGWSGRGGEGDSGGSGPDEVGDLGWNGGHRFIDPISPVEHMQDEETGTEVLDKADEKDRNERIGGVPLFLSFSAVAGSVLWEQNLHGTNGVSVNDIFPAPSSERYMLPGVEQDCLASEEDNSLFHSSNQSSIRLSTSNTQEHSNDTREELTLSASNLHLEDLASSLERVSLRQGHSDGGDNFSAETYVPLRQQSEHEVGPSLGTAVTDASSNMQLYATEIAETEYRLNIPPSIPVYSSRDYPHRQRIEPWTEGNLENRAYKMSLKGQSAAKVPESSTSLELAESSNGLEPGEGRLTISTKDCDREIDSEAKVQPGFFDSQSENLVAANHTLGESHFTTAERKFDWGGSCKGDMDVKDRERKALIDEAISLALKKILQAEEEITLAKRSETQALKRLQMETFAELLKIRQRLEKIEQGVGMQRPTNLGNSSGVARTKLKGEVMAGTAVIVLEDSSSRHSRSSLEQAGIQTGLDVRFTFETPFRERDILITQCFAGQASSVGCGRALGGPISLGKVLYSAYINDDFSLSVIPLGAHGKDIVEIINPLQDQALTESASNGPPLFKDCKGSAVGATIGGSNFTLSLAQYLSGWGNQISALPNSDVECDPLCLSTLGQFLFQPYETVTLSLYGLNRYWPSPPLPSAAGLHWSELGPLILPKIHCQQISSSTLTSDSLSRTFLSHGNNLGSPLDMDRDCANDIFKSKGTVIQSVAVAAEMELSRQVSIAGWAQVELGDWLQDSDTAKFQWGLSLAKTSGTSVNWGINIGASRLDFWSMETKEQEGYSGYFGNVGESYNQQLQFEAFFKFHCGRGFTLQPGVLCVLNRHSHTPALMLKSSWTM